MNVLKDLCEESETQVSKKVVTPPKSVKRKNPFLKNLFEPKDKSLDEKFSKFRRKLDEVEH